MRSMIRHGWGAPGEAYRQFFTSLFLPGGTAEQFHAFNALQALSARPEAAERHLCALAEIDVRSRLAQVRAPTLVVHCRDDPAVPMRYGQEIAAGIPGAAFVPLESVNHQALAQEPGHRQMLEAVARHLGEPPPPRVLPGVPKPESRVHTVVQKLKSNWLVELAAIVTTLAAAGALIWQLWRWLAD